MTAGTTQVAPQPVSVSRCAVRVRGGVQGVGFRPFVRGLSIRLGLAGFVGNDSDGVFIEVEGVASAIDACLTGLRSEAPPLARVDSIDAIVIPVTGLNGFVIVSSRHDPAHVTPVSPDVATCADFLREMGTTTDRRFAYPFINCTNCGPRYTIVTALPYDREQTSMSRFTMCAACATEYNDPANRHSRSGALLRQLRTARGRDADRPRPFDARHRSASASSRAWRGASACSSRARTASAS